MNINISLDSHTSELVAWHANATGLPISDVIDKLLSSHLAELWELKVFLGCSITASQREEGLNLLQSYGGGETVIEGIKRIAPDYMMLRSLFELKVDASMISRSIHMQ